MPINFNIWILISDNKDNNFFQKFEKGINQIKHTQISKTPLELLVMIFVKL